VDIGYKETQVVVIIDGYQNYNQATKDLSCETISDHVSSNFDNFRNAKLEEILSSPEAASFTAEALCKNFYELFMDTIPIDYRKPVASNIILFGGGACNTSLISELKRLLCLKLPHLTATFHFLTKGDVPSNHLVWYGAHALLAKAAKKDIEWRKPNTEQQLSSMRPEGALSPIPTPTPQELQPPHFFNSPPSSSISISPSASSGLVQSSSLDSLYSNRSQATQHTDTSLNSLSTNASNVATQMPAASSTLSTLSLQPPASRSIPVTPTSHLNNHSFNISTSLPHSFSSIGLISEEEWKKQLPEILRGNDEKVKINVEEEKYYYETVAKKFYEERIRLRDISYLTEQHLRELGLRMGDRIVFQNFCKKNFPEV